MALKNGKIANEGFRRCMAFTMDWLEQRDPVTGLIPQNLYDPEPVWNPHNAAADNFPFMVMTTCILDRPAYDTLMIPVLQREMHFTSRIHTLPDEYSLARHDFLRKEMDLNYILYGTSEYIKDGLLPLMEYCGKTPWFDRIMEMLKDLAVFRDSIGQIRGEFFGNSVRTEVHGELLQTLARVYWITGDESYLDWAISIGDHYLGGRNILLNAERLRLRDHGCEIIGGLSELYVVLHFIAPGKKEFYRSDLYELLDRILAIGRNEDGMFYNEVNMKTGEILDSSIVDNWGYIYNAYYTIYLLDQKESYRREVLNALGSLYGHYRMFNWENHGADGFADAIESGINLYNRERVRSLEDWIDSEIRVMWSLQDSAFQERGIPYRNRGIIEGWHGDGNFARTSLMYCLMKTQALTITPWREDVVFGAHYENGNLYIALRSGEDWEGTLHFGQQRHKTLLNLPLDYPRINQFPEWYYLEADKEYRVSGLHARSSTIDSGQELSEGLNIRLKKGSTRFIKITSEEHVK
ncbi:MAG TPA: hypothetical protein ENO05_00480 [Bacteroides sp.]|nr:hypothetical protein [Bacteroides sp.]